MNPQLIDLTAEATYSTEGYSNFFKNHWAQDAVEEFLDSTQPGSDTETSQWEYTLKSTGEATVIEHSQGVHRRMPLLRARPRPYPMPFCLGCQQDITPREATIRCPVCRHRTHVRCISYIYANKGGLCLNCQKEPMFPVPVSMNVSLLNRRINTLENTLEDLRPREILEDFTETLPGTPDYLMDRDGLENDHGLVVVTRIPPRPPVQRPRRTAPLPQPRSPSPSPMLDRLPDWSLLAKKIIKGVRRSANDLKQVRPFREDPNPEGIVKIWKEAHDQEAKGWSSLAKSIIAYLYLGRAMKEHQDEVGAQPGSAAEQESGQWLLTEIPGNISDTQKKDSLRKARRIYTILRSINEYIILDLQNVAPSDFRKISVPEAKELNKYLLELTTAQENIPEDE